jgi:hypothetical protein
MRLVLFIIIAHLLTAHPVARAELRQNSAAGCSSAAVDLGPSNSINVVVRCRGSQRGPHFQVAIASYPLRPGQDADAISGFRRRPRLEGSSHFGSCRRVGQAVRCEGEAIGQVRMLEVIRMTRQARCKEGISVTTSESGRCANSCPLGGTVHILARGRPKGC